LMKCNNNNSKNAVAQSSSSVPPTSSSEGTAAGVTSAASAVGGGVDLSSATETNDGAPNNIAKTATAPNPNDNSQHLVEDSLTARLDRIKTLLYEERSTSTNNVTQSGSLNLNWTPAIATSVFKSFTSSDDEESSGCCSGNDISPNNSIVYNINPTKKQQIYLLPKLIQNLPLLPFEARKSISAIFNYLLVCGLDGVDAKLYTSVSTAFANYVRMNAECVIGQLVRCHDCNSNSSSSNNSGSGTADGVIAAAAAATTGAGSCVDITLLCGAMLRSSLRHANIYQWILSNENCEQLVYPFLDVYVHNPNFDVSSDALETVRVMFTGHALTTAASAPPTGIVGDAAESSEQYKQIMESVASDFLNRKYTDVIDDRINKKCLSSSKANYMTRRMTLQLLSTILLNRVNYNVMMMYISSSKNLVTILCLLRDPSPHITLDAFQVFKIFVANPNKPPEVVEILFQNKVKLVKYLEGLHKERENSDDQYRDEKQLVISTLEGLQI